MGLLYLVTLKGDFSAISRCQISQRASFLKSQHCKKCTLYIVHKDCNKLLIALVSSAVFFFLSIIRQKQWRQRQNYLSTGGLISGRFENQFRFHANSEATVQNLLCEESLPLLLLLRLVRFNNAHALDCWSNEL